MVASPTLSIQSDEDLLDVPRRRIRPSQYETVDTIPVDRSSQSPTDDTQIYLPNVSVPPQPQQSQSQRPLYPIGTGTQPGRFNADSQHVTQPTQILRPSPGRDSVTDVSSPPRKPIVHVAASSPMTGPRPKAGATGGVLGQAMNRGSLGIAPAGTQFAPQYRHNQQFSQPSQASQAFYTSLSHDDLFPVIDSDDDDPIEHEPYRIKPKFAPQRPPPPPQSTAQGTFASLMSEFNYQSDRYSHGVKRSGDVMANSYGNVSKRPRQVAPARAQPVSPLRPQLQPQPLPLIEDGPTEINDISDPNLRNKARRMLEVFRTNTVPEVHGALQIKHGVYDDACDWLSAYNARKEEDPTTDTQNRTPLIIQSSDDELMPTPAKGPRGVAVSNHHPSQSLQQHQPPTKRSQVKSIAQKYSSTQQQNSASTTGGPPRILNVFDTPQPQEQKKRGLMRGRKNRSPSPAELAQRRANAVAIDDSDDDEPAEIVQTQDDVLTAQVLDIFNKYTPTELSDISGLPKDHAEHIIACRPFKSMHAIFEIQNPANKNKTKKGSTSFGERAWDKVYEMTRSYEAVDKIVTHCQNKSKPLARSMSNWGVDVFGKGTDTGLDLVNLPNGGSDSTGKDSGLGTPSSDDGSPALLGRKGFLGQPAALSDSIKMKDYQIVGLNWLYLLYSQNLSGILADDMGLGKTLQTIAFLAHLKSIGEHGPHLIVVPSATLENWLKEFHRFAPTINAQPYYGSMSEREQMRYDYDEDRDNLDVLVTTYVIAKAKEDAPWLRRFGFTCAIFDEGHMLKNPTSEVATKLTRIKTRFRLLLTGTPLQNNLHELMGLLKFLQPDVFQEFEDDLQAIFKQSISVTTDAAADSREMLLSKKRIDRARSMLTPFILRRKKWQVLKDLPKKTRHVEECDLSYEQVQVYNQQLEKAWEIRERKSRGERIPADESANILIRLRQAAIHPLLFRYFYDDKALRRIAKTCPKVEQFRLSNPDLILTELMAYADFETHDLCSKHTLLNRYMLQPQAWECSGKVTRMLELLRKFKKEGHRTLIFSQFVMVLDILQIILRNNSIPFLRLDGSTRVDERQDLIDLFNAEDSEYEVFMLSTKAGGAGINLTGASRVIVFDSGFNPQDDVQAENRCHRIGQTKDVEIYRLISKQTVEEQIYEMGNVKLQLDKEVSGADGVGGAIDVPVSGIATPMEDEETASKKGRAKKGADTGLSKREQEGAVMIEDMLFKKLEAQDDTNKGHEATSPPRLKVKTKMKHVIVQQNGGDSPAPASMDGSVDSPLSELSSIASDDERLKQDDSDEPKAQTGVRGRRKAATKAAENLKDPLDDVKEEKPSQKTVKTLRKPKKETKSTTSAAQSTISRSGRLVRGSKR